MESFIENHLAVWKEYAGTVYYNRFILGQWAAAGGIIYRPFADRDTKPAAPTS